MILVLGSSANALVAACYLAKGGQRVTVVRDRVPVEDSGWIAPKIARDLGLNVDLGWCDPAIVAPQREGPPLVLWNDPAKTQAEIAKHSESDARKWEAFSTQMARLAGFLETLYTDEPPRIMSEQVSDLFRLMTAGLRLRRLGKIDMLELLRTLPMSVQDLLDDWFESEILKAAVGAGGVTNILQGPRSAGTCFVLLHHLVGRPTFRARSRVRGLDAALLGVAKNLGVEVKEDRVVAIDVKGGKASGVRLASGVAIRASQVVSAADPKTLFLKHVDPTELPPEFVHAVQNVKLRGARALVELDLVEKPGWVPEGVGSISIAPTLDYVERAYDDAKHGGVSRELVLEASIAENRLSVAVQYVPYRVASSEGLGERVVATLADYGLKGANPKVHTPRDLESAFGLCEGHLYGGELTLDQILFMRPLAGFAHYATPIEGLFMCGDACHPGGGLPGLAGANAARSLLKDL